MHTGSMLHEHSAQCPTVFETLNVVHDHMCGTKSKFTYNVPYHSQRTPHLPVEPSLLLSGTLDGLVWYQSSELTSQVQVPSSLTKLDKNAGIQARKKVLKAIAFLQHSWPALVSLHHANFWSLNSTRQKLRFEKPCVVLYMDTASVS